MTSCKWELQLFLVTSLVVGAIAFGVTDYSASWGANLWQPENFKVTGVTSLAGNKVALVGMDSATGRGRIVEVTYTASGMTNMVTTGFDAAVTPDDLAYVGNVGGGDQYYLGRYTSGRGRIEPWNTVTGWGSELANYASYVLGLGVASADSNKVIAGLSKTGQIHEFGIGMTQVVSSGTSYFHGAASLGDINGDGYEDFVFCSGPGPVGNEASFASYIWYLESTGSASWEADLLGIESTVTTFSGIESLGDINNDGYLDLMLTRFSRTDMNYSWVDLIHTTIPYGDGGGTLYSTPLISCQEVWLYNQGIGGDISRDCYVDLADLTYIAVEWLEENMPETVVPVDDFNRADTPAASTNPKDVWFASDTGGLWEEYAAGNSGSGDQAVAPDAVIKGNRVLFSRMGWGNAATAYSRTFYQGHSRVQADIELQAWRDGTYFQSNSYAGLFMYDSATNAHAFLRIGPKQSDTGEHYFELNFAQSHDGEWTGWLLQQPRNIGSAELGSELGQITCYMEVFDNGDGDLKIKIGAEKNGVALTSLILDWYDDRSVFDQVRLYAKWDAWSKTTGAGAYIYFDDVFVSLPAEHQLLLGDLDKDDTVNLKDVAVMAEDWMRCNAPDNSLCEATTPVAGPFEFGTPLLAYDVEGLSEEQARLLFDGDVNTGIDLNAGQSLVIKRASSDELIWLAMHLTTAAAGSFTVECDDVMPVGASYKANQGWYRHRLPYSLSGDVTVTLNSNVKINEIAILGRTPLPTIQDAGSTSVSLNVSLSGVGSAPQCIVPYGFNFVFDQHGVADATVIAETKTELIQKLAALGVGGLRFPGGAVTYAYPTSPAAVSAYAADPNVYKWNYHLIQQNYWGYTAAEDYLDFCKDAGVIAWYQIDPGFYYDAVSDVARQIYHMDSTAGNISWIPDSYYGDYVSLAVAAIAAFAQIAKNKGVEVVWEIGNEDYSKYEPQTYAMLCKAFRDGILAVDASAMIAICADSYSWSDWSFPNSVVSSWNTLGGGQIHYASNHLYLNGGTLYADADQMGDWIVSRWDSLKSMFNSKLLSNFTLQGHTETKIAYTEFNSLLNSAESTDLAMGAEIDHSVGRALADAYITPNIYQQNVPALFFHDMVRNGPDSIYFARLDYYPSNPAGRRYHAYPEAIATAIVAEHGNGQIAYGNTQNNNGIWVSRHSNYVYITLVNRGGMFKNAAITLQGVTVDTTKAIERKVFKAASSQCSVFDYYQEEDVLAAPSSNMISFEAPCYSVTGLKVYIN